MAGDSNTRARAEMFELLLEDGLCCLTAITKKSWGPKVDVVDRILFHVAEHRSLTQTAVLFGLPEVDIKAIVEASEESELVKVR
jgi:hypothetical protein